MVVIPAGEITVKLSNDLGEIISTYTLHISNNFAIAVHETRVADWENCEFDGVCGQVTLNSSSNKTDFGWREWKGTRPVGNVSWSESLGYAIWLSSRTGKKYWLPSEVEWEYAARGGLVGKRYPWGDEGATAEKANYGRNVGKPAVVGSYPANGYGLYNECDNDFEINQFALFKDHIEIIENCYLPHIFTPSTPIIEIQYKLSDIKDYLKIKDD